jgi:hypothetical protein
VLGAPRIAPEAPVPPPRGATPQAPAARSTDRRAPTVTLSVVRPASVSAARRRGLTVRARCSEACSLRFELRSGSRRLAAGPTASAAAARTVGRRLRLSSRALRDLRRGRVKVRVTATDRAGNTRRKEVRARLRR